jgi:restriction system protein
MKRQDITLTDSDLLFCSKQTKIRNVDEANRGKQYYFRQADDFQKAISTLHWNSVFILFRGLAAFISTGFAAIDALVLSAVCSLPCTILFLSHYVSNAAASLLVGFAILLVWYSMFFLILHRRHSENASTWVKDRKELLIHFRSTIREHKAKLKQCKAIAKRYCEIEEGIRREIDRKKYCARQEYLKHSETRRLRSIEVDWLDGREFEIFLRDLFMHLGYDDVILTQQSNDKGVDLIVRDGKIKIAIQAKRYSGNVGIDAVQQIHSGCVVYNCHRSVVITNSRFTKQAILTAEKCQCELIDGRKLQEIIRGQRRL